MTATIQILWTRRTQRRKNKPYIAAKTYIVEYDGTLEHLYTVLEYTIRRRQRLVMVIVNDLQLTKTTSEKYILTPVNVIPEIDQQHPVSYLPYSRKTRTNPISH